MWSSSYSAGPQTYITTHQTTSHNNYHRFALQKKIVRMFSEDASGTSAVAIDNKIEQAMDLVKSHLMIAVREEVEVLKEKISELLDRINTLEVENTFLKAHVPQETLSQMQLQMQTAGGNNGTNQQQQQQPQQQQQQQQTAMPPPQQQTQQIQSQTPTNNTVVAQANGPQQQQQQNHSDNM